MTNDIATLETLTRPHDESPTTPREQECLPCFLHRMLAPVGCDNQLRWAEMWRRHHAIPALLVWLRAHGGYCDCEVLFNVYPQCLAEDEGQALSPCSGVKHAGSLRPCDRWEA